MTDEQFKQLMDKLEELKRAIPVPSGIGYPNPYPPAPYSPNQYQNFDGLPNHWRHDNGRD